MAIDKSQKWDHRRHSCDAQVHEVHQDFRSGASRHVQRLRKAHDGGLHVSRKIEELYLGVAAEQQDENTIAIGLAAHDGTYSVDFAWFEIRVEESASKELMQFIVARVHHYQLEKGYKFMGAGVLESTVKISPELPAMMWLVLDVPSLVFDKTLASVSSLHDVKLDEIADSMARKCIMMFGPTKQIMVQVGHRNLVEVDAAGRVHLATLDQYRSATGSRTWDATMKYVDSLKEKKTKIAFFNSTPQGGGVALMRHALVRFLRQCGVDISWYVPKPSPKVFRITKTNHNILQGVAGPEERLSASQREEIEKWTTENAERFWIKGPLAHPKDGGADFICIDDPQMPFLIPIAKKICPERPVVFRSHIQIRKDLVDEHPDSPTAEVWKWMWEPVSQADMFIAHPVSVFVPAQVPKEMVAYAPATTDWHDGLNKELEPEVSEFYMKQYNTEALMSEQPTLEFPQRDYVTQIARFDPSKNIPTAIRAYGELRRTYMKDFPVDKTPQLCITGHSAVDDPDGSLIFDQTMDLIDNEFPELANDISVVRLGPIDQSLNAIMSNAKVCLQLSTREGFEVKVSEAVHKGIPTIVSDAGGIPLQVQDGKSGFVVGAEDYRSVAEKLHKLFTDDELYDRMSEYAASHVSDEVGTVGNALIWTYLADMMTSGKKIRPNGRWINDLAREEAGLPYVEGETRLPRDLTT